MPDPQPEFEPAFADDIFSGGQINDIYEIFYQELNPLIWFVYGTWQMLVELVNGRPVSGRHFMFSSSGGESCRGSRHHDIEASTRGYPIFFIRFSPPDI